MRKDRMKRLLEALEQDLLQLESSSRELAETNYKLVLLVELLKKENAEWKEKLEELRGILSAQPSPQPPKGETECKSLGGLLVKVPNFIPH